MLCRTSKLIHPSSGVSLETPLLVPSFSSKAFGFGYGGKPEVHRVLDLAQEFITRTSLVSAYDVHYDYIPKPQDLTLTVDLMFLDSGGYEVSDDRDLSAVERPVHRPEEWDAAKLRVIWDRWPDGLPAVLVSYDHPNYKRPVADQLLDAKQAALTRRGHLHSFLLKPQAQEERTLEPALGAIETQIGELAAFQLLGLTEKELGSSALERMVRIAGLRQALDEASLDIPIHVFGALDPLSVCLYFVAGAEVFDGLTWSRYAYNSGQCIYVHNNAAVTYGVGVDDDVARVRTIKDNLCYLDNLERALRRLAETRDWGHLNDNRDLVRSATEQMQHQLGRNE